MADTTQGHGRGSGKVWERPWFKDHWVFWAITGGLAAAVLAGFIVNVPRPVPGWALHQQLVYRIEFAGILLVLAYVLLIALRLGWHNKTFSKLQVGPAAAETPAQEAAANELTELKKGIEDLSTETANTINTLDEQVQQHTRELADLNARLANAERGKESGPHA